MKATKQLNWRLIKARRRLSREFCKRFYKDLGHVVDDSIIVAGTGRSGTTWLASILASQVHSRIMFEPFHSGLVKEFGDYEYFQYMRPQCDDNRLYAVCEKILSGRIRHPWIDRQVAHLRPTRRVVKEIRANLFLKWIHDRFPGVPIVYIVRHPCAVVFSRMKLGWATIDDIAPFLRQSDLMEDVLKDKIGLIREANSPEELHAIVWAVSNVVPLSQFEKGELNVFFYEDLCTAPRDVIPKIFHAARIEYTNRVYDEVVKPSSTSRRGSSIVNGLNTVSEWEKELTDGQRRRILRVVREFGLEYLYGEELTPLQTHA